MPRFAVLNPTARSVSHREKAAQLRGMANSEVSETLRDQLTNLALQYELLAARLETPGTEAIVP
jgi:hypothetical protein